MRQVQELLVIRVGVDRCHLGRSYAEVLMDYFGNRRQAVGSAGRIGDHMMGARVVLLLVHSENDRDVFILGRSRDDHFLYAAAQVFLCVFGFGEKAGRFDHYLGTHRFPVNLCRVAFRKHAEFFVLDLDPVCGGGDIVLEISQHRIVLQQVRERLRVGDIVYSNEVDFRIPKRGAKNVAPDATKSIDADFNCHSLSILQADFPSSSGPSAKHTSIMNRLALADTRGLMPKRSQDNARAYLLSSDWLWRGF